MLDIKNKAINFVELFAGASGLGAGFLTERFNPIAMVEMDYYCCETLKTRMAYHYLVKQGSSGVYNDYLVGDIDKKTLYDRMPEKILDKVIHKEINADNFEFIKKSIRDGLKNKELDLILGGPPCQAYSIIGKHKKYLKKDDNRLYLYKFFASFLKEFKPKMFLFENVLGLLSIDGGKLFQSVKEEFIRAGYNISHQVLDSSDYGVLQKRKRVILIGIRKDLNISFDFSAIPKVQNSYLVADLFKDLHPLQVDSSSSKYIREANGYLTKYKLRDKESFVTCHEARPHNKRDLDIYKEVVKLWNKSRMRLKYNQLPEKLRTHKNIKSFLDRFKVVAGNIPHSHTMVSHIAKDGHHYIHPDIKQNRSLTVREAARIQSFPDNYFFEGPRTSQFTQVGNAVPPILAKALAKQIRALLCK